MISRKLRSRFLPVFFIFLFFNLHFTAVAKLNASSAGSINGRVRVYDSFGHRQGNELLTDGATRVAVLGVGYAVVDQNESRVRTFDPFGVQHGGAISTDGRAKIVPCAPDIFALMDNSTMRVMTRFGRQVGPTHTSNGPADAVRLGFNFIVTDNSKVRIVRTSDGRITATISTNSRARIVTGNTRFLIIEDLSGSRDRVRLVDLLGNVKLDLTTNSSAAGFQNENVYVIVEDDRVRFYNLIGDQIGTTVLTNGRANVAVGTDHIVVADNNRVRFYAKSTGSLLNTAVRKGTATLVTNLHSVAVIDDGAGKRLQIYSQNGAPQGSALTTTNRFDAKVSPHGRFAVVENSRVRILGPSGSVVNNNIPTAGRADIAFATQLIFVTDNGRVRIYDHFGNPYGDVFNTTGRADIAVNVQGVGISNNQRVRLYNHLRDFDGGAVDTNGPVMLATTFDRIIIVDEARAVNHAPVLNSSGSPAVTAVLEDAAANNGMLVRDLIASAAPVDMITDTDAGALEGLAITAVDNTSGQWQYSVDRDRRRWQSLTIPDRNGARLLAADDFTRLRFVPQANSNGTLSAALTFRAWDQTGGRNGSTASITRTGGSQPYSLGEETAALTVTAVNDPPSFTKGPNQTISAVAGTQSLTNWATAISAGPPNESGQSVSFVVNNDNSTLFAAQPAITPSGTLTYEPALTASGSATVSVVLSDDGGTANGGVNQSAAQTFTITVLADNGSPVAVDDEATTDVDTAVIIAVLDNDIEPDLDPLTVTAVTPPANGSAITDGTTVTYTPTGGFVGIDTFTYTISDGSLTDNGVVTVFVGPVNRAPVLNSAGMPALTPINEDEVNSAGTRVGDLIDSVLPLDMITDPDSGALEGIVIIDVDEQNGDWQFSTNDGATWSALGSPTASAGRLLAANGSTRLRFVPDPDFHGAVDSGITFRAWDQSSGSSGATADTAVHGSASPFSEQTESASIIVNPLNDAPSAAPDTANTPNGTARTVAVLGNDSDPDGDVLSIVALGVPSGGSATLNADSTILYEPGGFSGSAVFTYTVSDGALSDTTTVTVQVGTSNSGPTAMDDNAQTFEETAVTIPVLDNDSDPDGDTLVISQVGTPANGSATVLHGRSIVYTPIPGFTGSDSFSYTLSDGNLSDIATVTVRVAGPANDYWEKDLFDALSLGALHGQNGWSKARPDRASALVVPGDAPGDQILQIDPGSNQTIVMGKEVLDQKDGRHVFTVLVKVTGPVDPAEPTLAKIEFGTDAAQGWGKKFQLYFGASMRVNYGPTAGSAAVFVPSTVLDQWYLVQVDMDVANNLLDVSVDGSKVLSDIPMHPGPLTSLGISGWDRPGAVFLDELMGWQTWDSRPGGICGLSTFDVGDEGWRILGDAQDSSARPDYHLSGGNPGGYVSATDDVLGGTWYWVAPNKFLGNQQASYNNTLTFDLRQSMTSNQFDADDIIIKGNGFELVYDLPNNPGTNWTSYSVIFNEAEGWVNRATRMDATAFELLTVLADLQKLHIRGEYRLGSDVGSLDNVSFNAGCPQTVRDIYWINPNGGDMAEPSNWSTNSVPTLADHAYITLSGDYTVTHRTSTHPVALEFGSLTIGSDPTIWLNADSNTNSLLHVDDTIVNNGRILMQNTGPTDSTGWAWLVLESGAVENYGTIDLLPGPGESHEIFSSILNEGVFNQDAPLIYSGQFINRHIVDIAQDQELVISDPIEEISSFYQEDGVIAGLGTLIVNNQSIFNFSHGETTGPPPQLSYAYLNFEPDPTGIATFVLNEGTELSGNIGPEQTVIVGEQRGEAASVIIESDVTNGGTMVMEVGVNTAVSSLHISNGILTSTGTVHINAGSGGARRIQGDVQNEGNFVFSLIAAQELDLVASQFRNAPSGAISGRGTLDATHSGTMLTNAGTIQPGHAPATGLLTVKGDLAQESTANLLLDIAGPTNFARLHVTGDIALDGTVSVALLGGYDPAVNATFAVVTCGACTGQFAQIDSPTLSDNRVFTAVYASNSVTLTVIRETVHLYMPLISR